MFLVTANKNQRLLCFQYIEQVRRDELEAAREDIRVLLADLSPGFRVLADLSHVESIEPECAPEIGRTMELLDQSGAGLIVRVIPDASKDIGFNILTIFHYPHPPRIITCENLTQALAQLSP
jgi:hypothetical protein